MAAERSPRFTVAVMNCEGGGDEHFITSSMPAMMQAAPKAILTERVRGSFIMGDP